MAGTQKLGVFEDLKPISQWKEEPENNIITVLLPGFTKEQIKITCVKSSRLVRIHGERKLANNKWSRFNESFPIPENCKIDNIHAKWHDGSLTVTLPKEIITPIAPKEEPKVAKGKEATILVPAKIPQHPLPSKQGAAATSSSSISEKEIDKKNSGAISSPKATPSIQVEKQTDGKRVVDAHAFSAHQKDPQKGSEQTDDHDKTALRPKFGHHLAEHYKEKSHEAKKESASSQLKKPENVMDTTKTSEKSEAKKGKSKEEAREKKSIAAGALKAVMKQNDQERQSMVNMGVAVLVIVALGAYISYSFSSKSKTCSS